MSLRFPMILASIQFLKSRINPMSHSIRLSWFYSLLNFYSRMPFSHSSTSITSIEGTCNEEIEDILVMRSFQLLMKDTSDMHKGNYIAQPIFAWWISLLPFPIGESSKSGRVDEDPNSTVTWKYSCRKISSLNTSQNQNYFLFI